MKAKYIISALLFFSFTGITAQSIAYSYDAAGNREARYTIQLKEWEDSNSEDILEYNFGEEYKTMVFPNPTSGILSLELSVPEEYSENIVVHVKVYSIKGSLIIDENYYHSKFEIDLTKYPNGNYLLNLLVNKSKQNYMIIKE